MKVLLHYEDNDDSSLHKSLKITLPKSWKTGPTSKLLGQFVESYNGNEAFSSNQLQEDDLHLEIRQQQNNDNGKSSLVALASDDTVIDKIPDRADVYICHGPSQTLASIQAAKEEEKRQREEELKSTVACTHFGCKKRFPRGGPYPECRYHQSPPVFHETAKFWSCCPQKKAYDWETFQEIPGCQTGTCTDVKEDTAKQFLGGSDLREANEPTKLKSIDDFNKSQAAGGSEAAPVLERLGSVLEELGIEKELFNQVVEGMKKELGTATADEATLLEAVKEKLGGELKKCLKDVAAEQLRIK